MDFGKLISGALSKVGNTAQSFFSHNPFTQGSQNIISPIPQSRMVQPQQNFSQQHPILNTVEHNPITNYFNPQVSGTQGFWSHTNPIANTIAGNTQLPRVNLESIANNFKNPVGRTAAQFGLGMADSLLNTPVDLVQAPINVARDVNTGNTNPRQLAGDIAPFGSAMLNIATLGGGAPIDVATQGFKQGLLQGAKEGAITGAKYGGAYGLFGGLQSGKNIKDTTQYDLNLLKNITLGAGGGALFGGTLGGVSGGIGSVKRLFVKDPQVQTELNQRASTQLRDPQTGQWASTNLVKPKGMTKAQWEFQLKFNKQYDRNPYQMVTASDVAQAAKKEATNRGAGLSIKDVSKNDVAQQGGIGEIKNRAKAVGISLDELARKAGASDWKSIQNIPQEYKSGAIAQLDFQLKHLEDLKTPGYGARVQAQYDVVKARQKENPLDNLKTIGQVLKENNGKLPNYGENPNVAQQPLGDTGTKNFANIDTVLKAYKQHGGVDLNAVRAEFKNSPEALRKIDQAQAEYKVIRAQKAQIAKRKQEYGNKLNALANNTQIMGNNGQLDVKAISNFQKAEYELAKQYPDIAPNAEKIAYYEKTHGIAQQPVTDMANGTVSTQPESLIQAQSKTEKSLGQVNQKGNGTVSLESSLPQKGFFENVKTSEKTTPQVKEQVQAQPQTYEPISNKQSISSALKNIRKDPEAARKMVFDTTTPATAEKTTTGIALAKHYESQGNFTQATEVIDHLDQQLRSQGQSIQAASLWNKMKPETIIRTASKIADKYNTQLPQDFKAAVLKKLTQIDKMPEGIAKDKATLDVLSSIADRLPVSKSEIFDSYRYQNMLSGPKTSMRNMYQNLVNTYVTRPLDLAFEGVYDIARHPLNPAARDVALTDAPRYVKNAITSLPNAIQAAVETFKNGGTDVSKFDLTRGQSVIDAMRLKNVPKALRVVPDAMEAQDKFFSTLIASGEYNRLLSKGIGEAEAKTQATKLAQNYLLRDRLGTQKNGAAFSQALDSLGKFAMEGRKMPVVGKPYGWFVPFITTPINAGKQMIEHSPLGFVGGSMDRAQMAKATSGTIATAMGAILATQGRTTWAAPTSQTQKNAFYASGRKPYSVKIGNTWVPMWYAGPFALALAIPAAAQYYEGQNNHALSDPQSKKLTNIALDLSKFLANQSSVANVGSFFQMLNGDVSISPSSLAASTVGQVIPAQSLLRYVTQVLDPVYHKAKGFTQTLEAGIPGLSKNIPVYTTPLGETEKRLPINNILPYDVGKTNIPNGQIYDQMYKQSVNKSQQTALLNKIKSGEVNAQSIQKQTQPTTLTIQGNPVNGYQVGDKFIYKDSGGNWNTGSVATIQKNAVSYQSGLYGQQMTQAKNSGDFNTWMNVASQQAQLIQKQLQDPNLDQKTKLTLQNKLTSLVKEASKYQSYGNSFTKGKKFKTPTFVPLKVKLPVSSASSQAVSSLKIPTMPIANPAPANVKVAIPKPSFHQVKFNL